MSEAMTVLGLLVDKPRSRHEITEFLTRTTMCRFNTDPDQRLRDIRAQVHLALDELQQHDLAQRGAHGRWAATCKGEGLVTATRQAYLERRRQTPSKQRRTARRVADGSFRPSPEKFVTQPNDEENDHVPS